MSDTVGVIHDHYKDTFAYIREREAQRDKLFVVLALLLTLHLMIIRYAAAIANTAATVSVLGVSVDIESVPLPAVLSLSWTLLAALTLRYFQVTVHIDKQYDYLHPLEERLSSALGQPGMIAREGAAYFSGRGRLLRHVSWLFYLVMFPLAIIGTVTAVVVFEWREDTVTLAHRIFDSAMASFVVVVVGIFVVDIWWRRTSAT